MRQSSAPDIPGGGGQVLFRVQCAAGEQAVGGGAGVGASGTASELEQSFPISANGVPLADGETATGSWIGSEPVAVSSCAVKNHSLQLSPW